MKEEDKQANIASILRIMKQMNMDETIIEVFTEKMDQPLGNDGIKLSGGQRQMVWILRAMLRNSSIIILDEPTSALDKKNKEKIVNVIEELGKDKTIIIISHDDISPSFRKITMKQGELSNETTFDNWMM